MTILAVLSIAALCLIFAAVPVAIFLWFVPNGYRHGNAEQAFASGDPDPDWRRRELIAAALGSDARIHGGLGKCLDAMPEIVKVVG